MSAVGIQGSVCSGHGGFPPRPSAEGEPLLKVNGIPVLVAGNLFPDHIDIYSYAKHSGVAISTRPWFTVNGKPICCVGDPVSCGSVVVSGNPFFQVS
ncbi:PAAR domain-containing protein [Xenorhabdus eapokensis]|uniref:Alanine racemase n=1 Tax=Xenorhabdus eapokensis TaxID=1873482 RepID=A0A1Q5TMU8_9GAMM|nr:PAAR domain-containing protein [Xenorhabdus eapokensis]OKP01553.1 alanine racemase [Xenorhabdus eapokensis]